MSPDFTKRDLSIQHWNGDVEDLQILGNGVSGIVFAIDDSKVIKIHLGTSESIAELKTETEVYRCFNQRRFSEDGNKKRLSKEDWQEYVLCCLDTENLKGLVFERCRETLRCKIRRMTEGERAGGEAVRWAKQAAKALAWVHDCEVIHGDVSCSNMLLDSADNIKLADFAGSSIHNSKASANYELRNRLPDVNKLNEKSDIFALGSVIYEITTGHPPYESLSYSLIESLYRRGDFPKDLKNVPILGEIVEKCWKQQLDSAWKVVCVLEGTGFTSSLWNHKKVFGL